MLTKQDLNAIGSLIDTKLEEKLESKLEEKLESKLEEKLESKLEEKLAPIRKDIKGIKKSLNEVIDHFDRRDIKVTENIRDIQENLHMPLMNFA